MSDSIYAEETPSGKDEKEAEEVCTEPSAENRKVRRKGQPKGKDLRPLHVRVSGAAVFWTLAAGFCAFVMMLAFWSQFNVRLILDAAIALGDTAAESVDRDAAERLAERILRIRKDAPDDPTSDYTADEQVVILARYDKLTEDADHIALREYLSRLSQRYPYAGEFSLAGVKDDQLIYIVSPKRSTGYSVSLDSIDTAGPEHYDIARPESRREGTVILVPVDISVDGMELFLSCSYSFGGVLSGEMRHMAAVIVVIISCGLICAFRVLWIILRD